MARKILPDVGYRDCLGKSTVPWSEIWGTAIYRNGVEMGAMEIDGSRLTSGLIDPDRIAALNGSTILFGTATTLAGIAANATLGAGDPVGRINAGSTFILGTKITDGSLPFNKIDPATELTNDLVIGAAGSLQSHIFFEDEAGWQLNGDGSVNINAGNFWGVLRGSIALNGFALDDAGNASWGDQLASPLLVTIIDANGRISVGGTTYDNAPLQMDRVGNFFLADTAYSLSRIDPGAINDIILEVIPSQVGGQFNGNLTLTPRTRGARVYYTTDGSSPITSGILYTGPFLVNPGAGITTTVKAVARKMGEYGPIGSWAFTGSANTVAAPVFFPVSGNYFPSNNIIQVTISSGTSGATIKYTTDGTTPSAGNGTIYTGPFNLTGVGTKQVKAYATKAALTDSGVSTANYSINTGTQSPGGGSGPGGGGGHVYIQ